MLETDDDDDATRKRRRRSVRNLRRKSGILLPQPVNFKDEIEADSEKSEDHEAEASDVYGSLWMECKSPVTKKRRRRSNFVVRLPLDEDYSCYSDRHHYNTEEPQTPYSDHRSHNEDENDGLGSYSNHAFNSTDGFESKAGVRPKVESFTTDMDQTSNSGYNDGSNNGADMHSVELSNADRDTNTSNVLSTKNVSETGDENLLPSFGVVDEGVPESSATTEDVTTPESERNVSIISRSSPASMSPDFPVSPDRFVGDFNESFDLVVEQNQSLTRDNTDGNSCTISKKENDANLHNVSGRSDSNSDKENSSIYEKDTLNVTPQDTVFADDSGSNRSPGFLELCKTFAGKVVNFVKTSPSYLTGTITDSTNLLNVAADSTSPCLSKTKEDTVLKQIVTGSIEHPMIQSFNLTVCNVSEDQDTLVNRTNRAEAVYDRCSTVISISNASSMENKQKDHKNFDSECRSTGKKKRNLLTFFNAFNAISSAFNRERSNSGSSLLEKSPADPEIQEKTTLEEPKEVPVVDHGKELDSLNGQADENLSLHEAESSLKTAQTPNQSTDIKPIDQNTVHKLTGNKEEIKKMEAETLDLMLPTITPDDPFSLKETPPENESNLFGSQALKPTSKRKHKRRALSVPPVDAVLENCDYVFHHEVPKLSDLCERRLKICCDESASVEEHKARVPKTKKTSQRRRSGRLTSIKELPISNVSVSENTCAETSNENINENAINIGTDDTGMSEFGKSVKKGRRRRSFGVIKTLTELTDDVQMNVCGASERNSSHENQDEVDGCSEVSGASQHLETGIAKLDISERPSTDHQKAVDDESSKSCEEELLSIDNLDNCNGHKLQKRRGRPSKSDLVTQTSGESALASITEEMSQVAINEVGTFVQNPICSSLQKDKMLTPEDIIFPDDHPVPRKKRRRSATMTLKTISEEMANSPAGNSVTENQSSKSTAKASHKRKHAEVSPDQLEVIYKNKNFVKPEEKKSWQTIYESPHVSGELFGKKRLQRHIDFEKPTILKLKRRMQKAAKNGWDPKKKRKTELKDEYVKEKLEKFWSELEESSETSLENKLKNILETQ